MEYQRTIFAQLFDFIPKREFRRCVQRYRGDRNVRNFSCWSQYLCMVFAQLACKDSLREVEICLRSFEDRLYRLGLRGGVARSTLADANESRDSRIFRDFCFILIERARKLYAEEAVTLNLDELVYILDSTYINLCISLCPWAQTIKNHAYVKINTQLDLRGSIPSFITISSAKFRDNLFLDQVQTEPGAIYVMDKGYFDFARLYKLNKAKAYFVTRPFWHIKFRVIKSRKVDLASGIIFDQTIVLTGHTGSRKYPDRLRRVVYKDLKDDKTLVFITNHFELAAIDIAQLYKARWQIEIFFKWIKQNLRIRKFIGTSRNAIEIQIWCAISSYLLVAIARKLLKVECSLHHFLEVLSICLFEKMPINNAFSPNPTPSTPRQSNNQLILL